MKTSFFLSFIISIDSYLIAVAFRNNRIKIPISSAAVITLMGAAVLSISLKFSQIISDVIPPDIFHSVGMCIIITIGLLTVFKSILRNLANKISEKGELSVKMGKSPIMVKLYLDDTSADLDNSKSLSLFEAAVLALSNSIDAAAVGLTAGSLDTSPAYAAVFTIMWGLFAFVFADITAKKLLTLKNDLSWIGGLCIMILAVII